MAFEDAPALIRWRREYAPDPGRRALYDERFACSRTRIDVWRPSIAG